MNDMHVNFHSEILVLVARSEMVADLDWWEGAKAGRDQVRFANVDAAGA